MLRLAIAFLGAITPIVLWWGTYRKGVVWFPSMAVPWWHLAGYSLVALTIVITLAAVFARFGLPFSKGVIAAVVPMWALILFLRISEAIVFLTRGFLQRWWLLAVTLGLIFGIGWMSVRVFRGEGGKAITAAIVVVAIGTIAQNARYLLPPPHAEGVEATFTVTEPNNVWVLIFDELASPEYLAQHQSGAPRIVDVLLEQGFTVEFDGFSPYNHTTVSLGSILSLDPMEPGFYSPEAMAQKALVFGGDHPLARAYRADGRPVTYVEPPIGSGFCSDVVTDCRRAALRDFDNFVISNSIFSLFFSKRAGFWPLEGVRQMGVLEDIAADPGEGGLIIAHVMLPHEPFVLDAACQPSLDGVHSPDNYVQQVDCLGGLLGDLLASIPATDKVLIIGDHGVRPERGTLTTYEKIDEMLSPFVALRGCGDSTRLDSNLNAYRSLVNCVSTANLTPVDLPPMLACYPAYASVELVELRPEPGMEPAECP